MKTLRFLFLTFFVWAGPLALRAQESAPAPATVPQPVATTEFLEHLVDSVLQRFDANSDVNTPVRYGICAAVLLITFLLRRVVTSIVFSILGRLASKTETTLDDKLFTSLRDPVATLVVVVGGVGAFKALKFSDSVDVVLGYAYTTAFSLVIFWLFFAAFTTVLDHLHEVAKEKQMGVATLMPWIKKTLIAFFFIVGVLMIAQSLGADVKAFLAGLGIGGLAFALAAQDTIANLFGSVVVAIDQPFKVGDTVQIGSNVGLVEDIGLRSTKIRTLAKSLLIIPNKMVASEAITNLSRFTQRRVEQMIGLTYDAKADQIEKFVEGLRAKLVADAGIDASSVVVQFVNFGASSLDVQVIYLTRSADNAEHLRIRQKNNFAIMHLVESLGLSFAFPTQTIQLDSSTVRHLAASKHMA